MKNLHPVMFGTHLPCVMAAMARTSGRVLELGTGYSSSLYLHWACAAAGRRLDSFENHREWYETFGLEFMRHGYQRFHKVYFVEDFSQAGVEKHHWSVALVDPNPAEARKDLVRRLADRCDYIVIHDTEPRVEHYFRYSEIYPLFRWRYDYTAFKPWTAVLSNFVDLTDFTV